MKWDEVTKLLIRLEELRKLEKPKIIAELSVEGDTEFRNGDSKTAILTMEVKDEAY